MTGLQELLKELSQDSVPIKALGEVGTFTRGNGLQKSDLTTEGVPAIHYGQVHTLYKTWTKTTKSFTSPVLASKLRHAKPGDLIIATTSEDNAAVAKATAWLGESDVAVSGDAYIYQHTLDPRYVAYAFQSDQFQRQKAKYITGTKVRRISGDALAKIRIPVPRSKVQREIVEILDSLTSFTNDLNIELVRELEMRREQYAFYRDRIMLFSDIAAAPRTPMGDAGIFFGGLSGKTKADFEEGNARFVSYVNVYNNASVDLARNDFVRVLPDERQRKLTRGDIIFTGSSETPADVGMSSVVTRKISEPVYLNSFCIGYRLSHDRLLDPEFAKHLFRSSVMREQIVKTASGVTRFNISKARLAKVEFPVPSRSEQARVANLLDGLEALVLELSNVLSAELGLRRDQYAHYRDQLFAFNEAVA